MEGEIWYRETKKDWEEQGITGEDVGEIELEGGIDAHA